MARAARALKATPASAQKGATQQHCQIERGRRGPALDSTTVAHLASGRAFIGFPTAVSAVKPTRGDGLLPPRADPAPGRPQGYSKPWAPAPAHPLSEQPDQLATKPDRLRRRQGRVVQGEAGEAGLDVGLKDLGSLGRRGGREYGPS